MNLWYMVVSERKISNLLLLYSSLWQRIDKYHLLKAVLQPKNVENFKLYPIQMNESNDSDQTCTHTLKGNSFSTFLKAGLT